MGHYLTVFPNIKALHDRLKTLRGYTKYWEGGVSRQDDRSKHEFMDNSEALVGTSCLDTQLCPMINALIFHPSLLQVYKCDRTVHPAKTYNAPSCAGMGMWRLTVRNDSMTQPTNLRNNYEERR